MAPSRDTHGILWLKSATSTNYELRQIKEKLDNLSIVAAVEQTHGRGQGDHTWFSSPATNLTFSLLMRFPSDSPYSLKAAEMLLITQLTTLAIRDFLAGKGISARVKWPNDIWVKDRKICGILIENILDGAMISESIVGIGLNVNELDWPAELPNPVSMKELTGQEYVLEEELESLHKEICRRYEQLGSVDGRKGLEREFAEVMFRLREERQ